MALLADWSEEARADIRRLDKPTAMQLFDGLSRFLRTEHGDVKQLQGVHPPEFRLRVGEYRVRYPPRPNHPNP